MVCKQTTKCAYNLWAANKNHNIKKKKKPTTTQRYATIQWRMIQKRATEKEEEEKKRTKRLPLDNCITQWFGWSY